MLPGVAPLSPETFRNFLLCQRTKIIEIYHFLLERWQSQECSGKNRVMQQHCLSAGSKKRFFGLFRLCKVNVSSAERIKLFISQIVERDFLFPPCHDKPVCVIGRMAYHNLAVGVVGVLDLLSCIHLSFTAHKSRHFFNFFQWERRLGKRLHCNRHQFHRVVVCCYAIGT